MNKDILIDVAIVYVIIAVLYIANGGLNYETVKMLVLFTWINGMIVILQNKAQKPLRIALFALPAVIGIILFQYT